MGAIKYLLSLLLILIPATSIADTHNAASCSSADVATAIAAASNGDTVAIPAGTCTWTSGISLSSNKLLTLKGAGATSTVISHGNITAITMIGAHRITGIGFNLIAAGGFTIHVRQKGWRIDHCSFTNSVGSSQYTIQATGANETVLPAGLIDNNNFIQGRVVIDGMGTFLKNSGFWAADPVVGKADQVYIEDNTFYKTVGGGGNVVDTNYASSYVARYNTVTGTTEFMVHGWQDEGHRGARSWEIYGNSFTASANSWAVAIWPRSGTGIIAFNLFAGDYDHDITFDDRRAAGSCDDCYVVGYCDGSSYADGNIEANGWPCRDQIGRGKDASVWSANTTNPAPSQASAPAYLFANRRGASEVTTYIHNNCGAWILKDRDYYEPPTGAFDGTTGTGCGTLANRPGTCTAGVGYWATDQSCSDLTGMVGATPSTPISGTLYKCTATNTWTAYYTPYTYPHPLRGETDETAPTATWAIDSTGLIATATFSESVNATTKTGVSFTGSVTGAITATYKDGMPGGIVRYDLNKEVQQSDTVVVDYTTPGDGIKDLAGNALADISDGAVTNGSTQGTPPLVTLTIGAHTGATVNVYPGINCGSTCGPVEYDSGSVLTLNVTTLRNYTGCTIAGTGCGASTTMSEARTCTVTCTKISPDVAIGSGAAVTLGSGAVGTLY